MSYIKRGEVACEGLRDPPSATATVYTAPRPDGATSVMLVLEHTCGPVLEVYLTPEQAKALARLLESS